MIAKTNTQHYTDIADAIRYSKDGSTYESELSLAKAETVQDNQYFEDISTAIQSKTGQTEPYDKDELADVISEELFALSSLTSITIELTTEPQTVTPTDPAVGFNSVTVGAEPPNAEEVAY